MNGPVVLKGDKETLDKRKNNLKQDDDSEKKKEVERVKTDEVSIIPFVIRVLYPTMNETEFSKLSNNDRAFNDKSTFVCEDCYIHISDYSMRHFTGVTTL